MPSAGFHLENADHTNRQSDNNNKNHNLNLWQEIWNSAVENRFSTTQGAAMRSGSEKSISVEDQKLMASGILPQVDGLLNLLSEAQQKTRSVVMQAEGPVLDGNKKAHEVKLQEKQTVGNHPDGTKLGELKREPTELKALENAIRSVFLFSGGDHSTKEYTAAIAHASLFGKNQYVSSHTFAGGRDVSDPKLALADIGVVLNVSGIIHNHPDIDGRAYWLASKPDRETATSYNAPEYIITPKGEILRWQPGDAVKRDTKGYEWGIPKHLGNIDKTGTIAWFPEPQPLKGYPLPSG